MDTLVLCDSSPLNLLQTPDPDDSMRVTRLLIDDEHLCLREGCADLVFSNLGLHWVNDLPACLRAVLHALKRDGVFIGNMFGGDTLYELRCALQLAETERDGGFAPRVSPFVQAQDVASLLQAVGFNIITVDTDELVVCYPSMFELMFDLQAMGESNAAWNRSPHVSRETLVAASAIYRDMSGTEDGAGIRATFQVYSFIGWKPDESQPKPKQRGSANFSFKDIKDLDKVFSKTKHM